MSGVCSENLNVVKCLVANDADIHVDDDESIKSSTTLEIRKSFAPNDSDIPAAYNRILWKAAENEPLGV